MTSEERIALIKEIIGSSEMQRYLKEETEEQYEKHVERIGHLLKVVGGVLAGLNLVTLAAAMLYIFFVLPGIAVDKAISSITARTTVTEQVSHDLSMAMKEIGRAELMSEQVAALGVEVEEVRTGLPDVQNSLDALKGTEEFKLGEKARAMQMLLEESDSVEILAQIAQSVELLGALASAQDDMWKDLTVMLEYVAPAAAKGATVYHRGSPYEASEGRNIQGMLKKMDSIKVQIEQLRTTARKLAASTDSAK